MRAPLSYPDPALAHASREAFLMPQGGAWRSGGLRLLQLGGARAALGRAAARMLRHVVGLGWLGAGFMRASRGAHADVGGMARGSGWAERARWTHAEARMAL